MTRLSKGFVVLVMTLLFLAGLGSGLVALLSSSFGSALVGLASWSALTLLLLLTRILEELSRLRKFQERQVHRRDETNVDALDPHALTSRERVSA
jgi:hypothetical protein